MAMMSVISTEHQPRTMDWHPVISFTNEDYARINQNLDNPMVISVIVANFVIKEVLVDQGSSIDLLYLSTLKKQGIPKEDLKPFNENLVSFSGE